MRKLLALAVLLCTAVFSYAQIDVSGTVTDNLGNPLDGVSVTEKGTGNGTLTDGIGHFSFRVRSGSSILVFTLVNHNSVEKRVGSETQFNVMMELSSGVLQDIVLVGSRSGGRVKLETPVPVDVVKVSQALMPTARMDITSILNYAAPSFNYNKQSGSDGADHVDLATLRGLGPDQTLVLINGKRRHQTAFVAVFGTRGRGNSGTDLNAIPVSSIDRIEILRDGASAQYGSDAIAGVINIVLKKDVNKFSGNIGYSAYLDPKYNPAQKPSLGQYIYKNKIDGNALTIGANYGVPVGKKGGFANFSLDFLDNRKTYRQALETDETKSDFMYTNIYRRAHGDGSLTEVGGFLNMEVPMEKGVTFYAFGGYNYKKADAYAFTRNWSARPERFPTDANGDLIEVPGIIMTAIDGEKYFNPHIQTKINDYSGSVGFRGKTNSDWKWDASNTTGRNYFHFFGDKTFNAGLGPNKNHFDDGGFTFFQNTTNLNFTKALAGIAEGFNLALGAEYRYERYTIFAGEPDSYKNYDPDKASGSQGFPGYQPTDEVKANRSNIAAYADAEMDVTSDWLIEGAVRLENYSDFGFTHNYKFATRYKASGNINFRGSVSTGFRAPSLQQINFSSTFTTVQGGQIAEVKIAPNDNPITKAAGIPDLKQEKSVNVSAGFTWKPINQLSVTVDGYLVKVKDRVVLSGQFDATDGTLDPDLTTALQNLNVSLAQFFANAVNTTNKGVDIVLEYNNKWGHHSFRGLFTGNFQDMTIDKINVPEKLNDTEEHRLTFLSDREETFILASAPKNKFAFNFEYGINKFTFGTRLTFFGKVTLLGYGEDGLGIHPIVPTDANPNVYVKDQYVYRGKMVNDLYLSYKFTDNITLFAGADNIFNVHPDLGVAPGAKGWAFNNETGGPWDAVQMGGDGTRYFLRVGINF